MARPMPTTASPVETSSRTPASSVEVAGLSPEKYEETSELPAAKVAVDARKSTPTSTAVPRKRCPLTSIFPSPFLGGDLTL